jgi:serine/threonine protein kinase
MGENMTTADAIIALELGHYRLREQIGGSAYGIIWRATGPQATRDVAIKLINQQQMERALPPQRERWTQSANNEIAFLQSLEPWDERHIVRLLDSGWHEGLPVLALELMGTDLGKHMATLKSRGETVPLPQALGWIAQINQALAKVHQYGWRYLDLKPANVLLDPHLNSVKLADFGTNRHLGDVQAHSYAGTANWQAPEQFFPAAGGGYATGVRSDYFSLGAMLYFLVTGGLPLRFCSDCGQAYREHHVAGADLLRGVHGGAIPAALHLEEEARFAAAIPAVMRDAALELLRALLHVDPAKRPRHAIQISRMLNAIQGVKPERGAFNAIDPIHGMRGPTAANNWRTIQGA